MMVFLSPPSTSLRLRSLISDDFAARYRLFFFSIFFPFFCRSCIEQRMNPFSHEETIVSSLHLHFARTVCSSSHRLHTPWITDNYEQLLSVPTGENIIYFYLFFIFILLLWLFFFTVAMFINIKFLLDSIIIIENYYYF